jgi:hypothetical protein
LERYERAREYGYHFINTKKAEEKEIESRRGGRGIVIKKID